MDNEIFILVWLETVAFIGAVLGYLSIRYNASHTGSQKLKSAGMSIATGMFAAWIIYTFARHLFNLHVNVSLAIGALAAYGGTDTLIILYQRLKKYIDEKKVNQ